MNMLKSRNKQAWQRIIYRITSMMLAVCLLSGCSGIAKGVTEALLADKKEKVKDKSKCFVSGRAFAGLESFMREQEKEYMAGKSDRRVLKVLMVHGIGSHQPGYATRLAQNLARALSLPQTEEKFKEIRPVHPNFPGELGTLRVTRYFNTDKGRELLFYELTWDPIIEEAKQSIAFDNSGEFAFRRTGINNRLKLFVNDTVPDVMLYQGKARERIQVSVSQSLCLMMSETWQTLPKNGQGFCDGTKPENIDRLSDDYAFITHSLGSRVTADALHRIVTLIKSNDEISKRFKLLQEKSFTVFMLSNQLPLLQLGRPAPEVNRQINEICRDNSPRADERMFRNIHLIAFSDPNDLFSYSIPPKFVEQHIDSRICPSLTNVILNVATPMDLFGFGKFANPIAAHTNYDNDERVINLIVHGIGHSGTAPEIAEHCEWLEAVPAKQ